MPFQKGNQLSARPLAERFAEKVRRGPDCWVWTGATTHDGYGMVRVKGVTQLAHRVAWEQEHGPIPDGQEVCHSCDNPPCVRGEHLFLGTHRTNMEDAQAKGRIASGDRAGARRFTWARASGTANGAHTRPERRPRGERNGQAKLTREQVDEIRAASSGGATRAGLGRKYGVSETAIRLIVQGKSWRAEICS